MNLKQANIVCVTSDLSKKGQAQILANELDILYLDEDSFEDYKYFLKIDDTGICIFENKKNTKPFFVDFIGGKNAYRKKHGGGVKQDIAKAVGIKNNIRPHILDATAGLGRDSFIFASLGCKVDMVERSPILFKLLEDGLQRASNDEALNPIISRMKLTLANSIDYISNSDEIYDVIYLDPMFPERDKSALVKKEMRIVKDLVGDDQGSSALLDAAINKAKYRVVVKRPRLAPTLTDQKPSAKIEGKSNRFDLYV